MSTLSYHLIPQQSITNEEHDRMFILMDKNYDHISKENFSSDLQKKEWVGLIKDTNNIIQGFTTFSINPENCAGAEYHILFSGDTIISPEYWGSQVMVKGWGQSVGTFISADQSKPWYWYLMSKGHRTYMYLPLFFKSYYPSVEPDKENEKLKKIAHDVSTKLYGKCFKPDLGIIQFSDFLGELKPELVEATYRKKNSQYVKFFLEKNPGFYKGDELVCISHIHPENISRSSKSYIIEGMEKPLCHFRI